MKAQRDISDRKLVILTVLLYLLLWLGELGSKIFAVLGEYSTGKVNTSLMARVGEGARSIGFDIFTYVFKLLCIYILFAVLNGHLTVLAAGRLKDRGGWAAKHAHGAAFLAVNGTFLAGVYCLNAALYPDSGLASGMRLLISGGDDGILRVAGAVLMGLYLLTSAYLNIRFARKAAKFASLVVWVPLLLAPLDPAFLIRKMLPWTVKTVNEGPNVIFIGLDSVNPLHTGYFGYPLPTTPHLDAFMKENAVFENCYTPIARTFPAWYSILTGQYPLTNGVRLNLMKRKYIKSAEYCLGNVLKKRGYWSEHFTDEVRFSNITREDGFDRLRHPPMGIKDFLFGGFHDFSLTNVFFNNPLGYRVFPFLDVNRAVGHLYDGRYFVNDLVSSLDRLRGKRQFFLAAHLCTAHWPYTQASPRSIDPQPGADPLMHIYDTALMTADEQLGRILAALKAAGLYDNSIIVVLSDHGESAEGHGTSLGDSGQNRTLLAWKPAGPPVHRHITKLARTIDIAPTVLDYLGEDPARLPYDGVSLRPWLAGSAAAGPGDSESVIMETEFSLDTPGGVGLALQSMVEQGIRFYEFDRSGLITVRDDFYDLLIRRRNRAIQTPDWKLVYDILVRGDSESVKASLFDVRNDPRGQKDLAAERPDVFKGLINRLRVYYGEELAAR